MVYVLVGPLYICTNDHVVRLVQYGHSYHRALKMEKKNSAVKELLSRQVRDGQ